ALHRARPALFWGLAVFVTLQLGLSGVVESLLPQLRDPEYAYRAKYLRRQIAVKLTDAPVVVVLGSSRTLVGVKAAELQEALQDRLENPILAFNFGLTGAGPLTQLISLRRLLAEGVHPDLLVLEVLPPFLAGQAHARYIESTRLPASRLRWQEIALLERYG